MFDFNFACFAEANDSSARPASDTHRAKGFGAYTNVPVKVLIETILAKNDVELKAVYRNDKLHHYEVHADGEFFSKTDELQGAKALFATLAG